MVRILDIESPSTGIGVSEGLDRSFNFSEVFQLVKKSVKTSLGKRRTGLMLGLADLPDYIGAFHQTSTCTLWVMLTRER